MKSIENFVRSAHDTAKLKGFWDPDPHVSLAIRLVEELDPEGCGQVRKNEVLTALRMLTPRNHGEVIALMHSELSEMLEAIRNGNPPSEKIPDYTHAEEEAADLMIRMFDYAASMGFRLEEAIEAKMAYNDGRPYKHGKAF